MVETKDLIDLACEKFKEIKNSNVPKFNTIDKWINKESCLYMHEILKFNNNINYKSFKRGQIIKVDFGINPGSELCYTHFAIVLTKKDSINSDNLVVVPITSKKGNNLNRINVGKILKKFHPKSSKYNRDCYINISQIRAISKSRIFIDKKENNCGSAVLNKIDTAIINEFTNLV